MRTVSGTKRESAIARTALLAGFAGGMAEIAWICVYCYWTGQSATMVAREVAASVFLPFEGPTGSLLGVAIHMALSLALGFAYTFVIWPPATARYGKTFCLFIAAAVLAMIWAINFFLVLPVLNPRFVGLMPYSVTLISKILFGVSMGWVLRRTYAPDFFRATQRALLSLY